MPFLQDRLSTTILSRIRARRESSEWRQNDESVQCVLGHVSVREAQLSDFERVSTLGRKLGQGSDSLDNWRRLWSENPAVIEGGAPSRIGWVLQDGSELVGFLGSIPLLYEFGGRILNASATCRLAVTPAYRAFTHLLVSSFLRQKEVDLFLNTTATASAGKMMSALKMTQLPQPDYGTVLFWVLDPSAFSQLVLKKLELNRGLSKIAYPLTTVALWADCKIRQRFLSGAKKSQGNVSVLESSPQSLGSELDHFTAKVVSEFGHGRLMAQRNARILKWHFTPPKSNRPAYVLRAFVRGQLVGYAVIRHEEGELGTRRTVLSDLLVSQQDPKIIEQLFSAAYRNAVANSSSVLEVIGFPRSIRNIFQTWKPHSRQYPACPFFFKARDRTLHSQLENENAWYACPFDGDTTLWP